MLFLVGISSAQKIRKQTVYLKNGSVVKGRVIEYDDQNMAIQSARNTWVFKRSEIDSIATTLPAYGTEDTEQSWFARASFGVLVGSANNQKNTPFSFDFSANFKLIDGLYVGPGVGVDFLEESYLPAFVNLEYHLRKSEFTPFVSMKAGYLVPLERHVKIERLMDDVYLPYYNYYPYYNQELDAKGGLMLNPSVGFISYLSPHFGLSLSVGYRYSQTNYDGDNHYKLEANYNRLSFHLGLLFN